MNYRKSLIDYVALTQDIAENIGTYNIRGEEYNFNPTDDKFVRICDNEYYYSSLRDLPNREDFNFFNVEILHLPIEIISEKKEEAEKYQRRGWCRKYDSIARNYKNWKITDEAMNEATEFINRLHDELSKQWKNTVIVSTINTDINLNNRYSDRIGFGTIRICIGCKRNDLIEVGKAPDMCMNCPYFEMAGVETAHEWVEFYPYCRKMKNGLGGFDTRKENVNRPDNCPMM